MAIEVGFEAETTTPIETSSSEIPTEIVSDEEMSLIDAAFAFAFAARSSSSSTHLHFRRNSINLISKRNHSVSCFGGDIEDGNGIGIGRTQNKKKKKINDSLLHRFRRKTGLFVTDITSMEWCEKQTEFFLLCGKPKATKAMKAGSARHAILEEEKAIYSLASRFARLNCSSWFAFWFRIASTSRRLSPKVITKVEVLIRSAEERWALKMINFIHGTNQLFLEGLTRELPVIGFTDDVCIVGIIDEIQMTTITESIRIPTLVETKTRAQDNLPSEPQRRNGRLQLMCYKNLWDKLIANPFPSKKFLELFSLNPNYVLSDEIQDSANQAGVLVQTLDDVIRKYQNVCSTLPETHHQLRLRYEYQEDQSLISEDQFSYDLDWVTNQIRSCIKVWTGEREARYAHDDERWKCKLCKYKSKCSGNTTSDKTLRGDQVVSDLKLSK